MLVNLYESKTPIAVFSLPLLVSLFAITVFVVEPNTISYPTEWQNLLMTTVHSEVRLNYLLTIFVASITAHQLNNVYNQNSFYSKASFLPGFIYISVLVALNCLHFSPTLLAHLFFVWGLGQMLKLRRQEQAKSIIFKASLLYGLAFIFSPLQIGLVTLPWIALGIFRPFVWREWVMVLVGVTIPFLYYFVILYLFEGDLVFLADPSYGAQLFTGLHLISWLNYIIFGLIVGGSLLKYLRVSRTEVNRFKLQSQVLFHFLWIAVFAYFLGWYLYDLTLLSLAIPLSIIIGTQMLHNKNLKVVNGIVIIWLIISVANVLIVG